jgi:hypothetical protein
MHSVKTNSSANQQNTIPSMLRLVLYKGELYRVPAASQGLRVVSGTAWVTMAGQDVFLEAGEEAVFTAKDDKAVASALGHVPVVLEVWKNKDLNALGTLITRRHNWQRAA